MSDPERARALSRARTKKWVQANPDKQAAAQAAWRAKNPDYSAEANRKWREQNPGRSEAWYQANRERVAKKGKLWREANAERKAVTNRAWREANRAKESAAARLWQKANPEKAREIAQRRRARKKAATVGPVDVELLWQGGGFCGLCDEPVDPDLTYPDPMSRCIDHIVPLAKGGTHEQANVQLAHLVCNNRKGARVPLEHHRN